MCITKKEPKKCETKHKRNSVGAAMLHPKFKFSIIEVLINSWITEDTIGEPDSETVTQRY